MSSNLVTPVRVESTGGLAAWLRYIGAAVTSWPPSYRAAYAKNRRRTILLTLLVVGVFLYPLIYPAIPSNITRALPLPSSTVVMFMLIFGIMAIGLNIVIGFAGLLDLGYVAFYAIGAYTAAFLASPHFGGVSVVLFSSVPPGFPGIHLPFMVIFLLAAAVAAVFGALLGAPTLRLRGDYLAIVTLGFGEIVPIFFKNLVNVNFTFGPIQLINANLTGGPLGINPIDPPSFLGIKFGVISGFAPIYLGIALVILAIVVARNLERSRMGRAWMAIREDEIAAEMMGVNTVRTKLLAFALGAAFAGVAGCAAGVLPGRHDVRLLHVLDLDPGRDHDHPRRHREHLGRAGGRRGRPVRGQDPAGLGRQPPGRRRRRDRSRAVRATSTPRRSASCCSASRSS